MLAPACQRLINKRLAARVCAPSAAHPGHAGFEDCSSSIVTALVTIDANKVSPKRETVMKEADLFRQYAKEASLGASSNLNREALAC
jgi:hypothetical protein